MGQSLSKVYVHIVFGTKLWKPLIFPPHDKALYGYIANTCKNHNCASLAVNGFLNHIHILCRLDKRITIADLLMEIKTDSSKWMKTQDRALRNFYWQDGYFVVAVCESAIPNVRSYIERQKTHHGGENYKDEIRRILDENGVEYDERYMWD